ncbi:MAG: hypothetical protein IJ104_01995 [Methanobrevibacter sp.]|nr:hypothetical protein [Methanobrevibacter sp.]
MSNNNSKNVLIILFIIVTAILAIAIQYYFPIISIGGSALDLGSIFILWLGIAFIGLLILVPILDRIDKKESGNGSMYVRECKSCGYTIGDPNGKLDSMKYNTTCFKCGSSHMEYRKATRDEENKMKSHLMDVYKG